ncbi:MAG: 1-deoxy-D-xylulose-5-phosphate reductoisomerase [Chlorobi bacterium]|nr:1-deoxy-D-xylulose-5-phosphate reductoisomerase [Chlorobiota bacterium]
MLQRTLTILGSTGSIGTQTLDVVRSNPERYRVGYLTTNQRGQLLAEQIREFSPTGVVVFDPVVAQEIRGEFGAQVEVLEGEEGACTVASRPEVDIVVSALVGFAGVGPTIAAIQQGKRIALANKETLVAAGELITRLLKQHNAELIPVDSEHSAIHQCLVGESPAEIEQLILTASGGPFRELPAEQFAAITPDQALRHPNWSMGPKITIDSATLMNKGLEVMEARWLFDVPPENIGVVVHPQSIIHSMVQFVDGSVKAQLGLPDMRLPIQYALGWPERIPNDYQRLSLPRLQSLTFSEPDLQRFPCLQLAFDALRRGGTAPAILNAANEVAVAQFLDGQLRFTDIPRCIERALERAEIVDSPTLEDILAADARTRKDVRREASSTH